MHKYFKCTYLSAFKNNMWNKDPESNIKLSEIAEIYIFI